MNIKTPLSAALLGALLVSPSMAPEDKDVKKDENQRPICVIQEVGTIVCQGDTTSVLLDGSASFDVDGDKLTYAWLACPNSTFDDATSATPLLTIDTSTNCDQVCGVRFQVSDGEKVSYCRVFVEVRSQTGPHLDIKPGSCPNPINVSNYQATWASKVAVSLLGNDLDVTETNISSLRLRRVDGGDMAFGGGNSISPVQNNMSDTGTPYLGGGDCGCHAVGGDGTTDLDLKFFKVDIIEAFNLTAEDHNTFIELELVGELMDGTPFSARDCIRVLNNG